MINFQGKRAEEYDKQFSEVRATIVSQGETIALLSKTVEEQDERARACGQELKALREAMDRMESRV